MSAAFVTILGSNSAVPAFNRHPTSQVLELGGELILIDCGEATQIQMQKFQIKRNRINHIFISHLHGDHYFGLIGLITSYGLMGRTTDLHIYSPNGLAQLIQLHLQLGGVVLPYALHFIVIEQEGLIFENNKIKVHCFPTIHRIACFAFKFEEKRNPRKIDVAQCIANDIPAAYYRYLQLGNDYETKQGKIIKNETVTIAADAPKTYAYGADTIYNEAMIPFVSNVDLLYHETTFLKDLAERAAARYHSTTVEAATIALKANVKKLVIGHFSSKYKDLAQFKLEAAAVFENVELAIEGTCINI
jgi:ribonuclease Z